MTGNDLEALGAELIATDNAGDPRRLAALAWQLYAEAGLGQAKIERPHYILRSFPSPGGDRPSATSTLPAPAGSKWARTSDRQLPARLVARAAKAAPRVDVRDASPVRHPGLRHGPRPAGAVRRTADLSRTWPMEGRRCRQS